MGFKQHLESLEEGRRLEGEMWGLSGLGEGRTHTESTELEQRVCVWGEGGIDEAQISEGLVDVQ